MEPTFASTRESKRFIRDVDMKLIPGTGPSAQFPQRRQSYGRGGAVGGPVIAPKTGKMTRKHKPAARRLMQDFKEIFQNPMPNIDASPLSDNLYEWHCNLHCPEGKFAGITVHLILKFPKNYPNASP